MPTTPSLSTTSTMVVVKLASVPNEKAVRRHHRPRLIGVARTLAIVDTAVTLHPVSWPHPTECDKHMALA